ncbi:MAG: metalloprotease PmbA [Chromatiales bacterium]|nr:metalloprotease PmbA [Chromatiales bacterium]
MTTVVTRAEQADDVLARRDVLERVAAQVLDRARERGASAAEVDVALDAGLTVTARLGEVETIEHQRDQSVGVTVYFGQRKAHATGAAFDGAAVDAVVEAACAIAQFTQPDPYAGLADAARMAHALPELDLYHPWAGLDAETAIELAVRCEAAARGVDPRITNSEGATVSTERGLSLYANSHGFAGAHSGTRHSISCSVIAADDAGMQRDYWYDSARRVERLAAAEAIGRTAGERAIARLGARTLGTRSAPVLFDPSMARSLVRSLFGALAGSAQYRKSSFLLDRAGERIFPDWLRIHERPHLRGGNGSAAFDGEGVATVARDWIADGAITGYVLDSYSARRLGLETTGNAGGVRNVRVEPGGRDDLLAAMGTGLVVTEMMGQGVNAVTGDYSRGAAGYWVENGTIAFPVEEITIAGNLKDMFAGLVAVGSDVDTRGNIETGSWLLERMTIAGE